MMQNWMIANAKAIAEEGGRLLGRQHRRGGVASQMIVIFRLMMQPEPKRMSGEDATAVPAASPDW